MITNIKPLPIRNHAFTYLNLYKECYWRSGVTMIWILQTDINNSITTMQRPGLMVLPDTGPKLLPVNTTCTDHCRHKANSQWWEIHVWHQPDKRCVNVIIFHLRIKKNKRNLMCSWNSIFLVNVLNSSWNKIQSNFHIYNTVQSHYSFKSNKFRLSFLNIRELIKRTTTISSQN